MAFRFKRPLSVEVLDKGAMLKSTLQWNAKLQQSFRLLMDFHNLENDESWVPVKLAMLSSSPYSEALALIQGSQANRGPVHGESGWHIVNFVNEKHDATIIRHTVQYT